MGINGSLIEFFQEEVLEKNRAFITFAHMTLAHVNAMSQMPLKCKYLILGKMMDVLCCGHGTVLDRSCAKCLEDIVYGF